MMTIQLYGGINPYPWQKDAHNKITEFLESGEKYQKTIVIKAARQRFGKSAFCKAELLRFCFHKQGSINGYVSPTLKLAKKMYSEIVRASFELIKNKNSIDLTIEFINGSVIRFFSGEMREALRGFTITGLLVVDEASYIGNDTYYELILPWITVHKAMVIMVSTPRYKAGLFYDSYKKGLEDGKFYVTLDWVRDYDCPIDESTLLTRNMMPALKWKSEYLGLFLDGEGSIFNFEHCIQDFEPDSNELYFGLDFGTGSGKDSTVLSALNENKEQCFIWHTNDMSPTDQIKEIAKILKSFGSKVKKVVGEQNSIGKIYLDGLKKEGLSITSFNTSNDSKRKLVERLQVEFQNGTISIMDDEELKTQLAFYDAKVNPNTNKVSYNAPNGMHDDMVISLMLALEAYEKSKTSNITFKWI